MTSLAYADRAARAGITRRSLVDLCARRGSDVLLAIAMLALAAGFLAYLPGTFSVDSWLALTAGREVWTSGLPHHETLTAVSHGAAWIDQQWLAELASYAIYLLGGLALLGLVNVALLAAAVAGAVRSARRLGAQPAAVMLALPLCLWLVIPSREVRTQELALPLFVATVFLLASDSRLPSRRVLWCLPILALWGNLHGTVTLGVLLVVLRGLTLLWERRTELLGGARAWRRPLTLILGAPACLLATPYGLDILAYYHTMFLDSSVRHAVTEWQPITSEWIIAGPFFVLAAVCVWAFGRYGPRTLLWERLALAAMAAGSVTVIRNVLFFALCALVILPQWLDSGRPASGSAGDRLRGRLNALLALIAAGAVVIAAAATLLRPPSVYELGYERMAMLAAVERATAAHPSLKVLADVRFADWLLWRDPALRGRIANDARFELMTGAQTLRMQRVFAVLGPDWKQGAQGYRLLVLDRSYDPDTVRGFLAERGARILYDDGERLVILRAAGPAAGR